MAFQDQTLQCRDCGETFVWTAREQEFYQEKGFTNAPVRCPKDRALKKQRVQGERQMFEITCATCGKKDTVPFKPSGTRPVYCREHFQRA
jgi:CxxC-x17-CxxC domain-containing protein